MKKLVLLDADTWRLTEVDPVKVKRYAQEFKRWLLQLDPEADRFGFLTIDLPLVEAAIEGKLPLPYTEPDAHETEIAEGRMPREYLHVSSAFYNTIRGEHCSLPEIVVRDGKRYANCDFEVSDEFETRWWGLRGSRAASHSPLSR
ncbi:hypothetical protein VARIO8X_130132 [Burkholderiales bacterium 8X]|nr:hypothetical protein VARIO8X_130132 [Burkholderiales bacterium 8X]